MNTSTACRLEENLPDMFRRIQYSAIIAVGGIMFLAALADEPRPAKPTRPYVDEPYGFEREKHPAICMTHHAAMKYCEWLSKKTGKDYRLPTEAEWEYACRAGTTSPYGIPEGAKLEDYAWYKENSGIESRPAGAPHAIGTKKPNAWGIHDMHGNVMEWC